MAAGPRIQAAGVSGLAEVESSKRRPEPERRFRVVLRSGSASAAASATTTAATTGATTTGTAASRSAVSCACTTGAATTTGTATITGTATSGVTRAAYCCAHSRSRPFTRRRSHVRYRHIALARAFHHALAVLLAQLLAFLFRLRSAQSRAILFTLLLRHELIGIYLVAILGLEGCAVAILRAILLLRVIPIARAVLILRAILICGQADDRSGAE
jgi:hypothetical protein